MPRKEHMIKLALERLIWDVIYTGEAIRRPIEGVSVLVQDNKNRVKLLVTGEMNKAFVRALTNLDGFVRMFQDAPGVTAVEVQDSGE